MEVELNVPERLTAVTLLPEQGSFVTLKLVRELSDKLGLSAKELEYYEVEQEGGGVHWNDEGNTPETFHLETREAGLLEDALVKLDEEEALEQRHFSLYEKFVTEDNHVEAIRTP